MNTVADHLLYGLAWASFGAGHSLLASARVRAWLVARAGAAHRVVYNGIAVVHVAAVAAVGWMLLGDAPAFALPDLLRWAMTAVALGGVVFMLWALRFYDTGRLLGTAQLRHPQAAEDEPLRLDGPHSWMRHPLYTAGFLILWGRALDPFGLATAVWASAYLVVGTLFEERKLLRLYGAAYAAYRRDTPMYLPKLTGRR